MSEDRQENTKGTTRDVLAAQRAQTALKLRSQRLSWDEVAARAGYGSRGAAHNAVMRELSRCVAHDVEEWRREELASLDLLEQECQQLFLDKKNRGRLFALDRILAIKERRAKLKGLDVKESNVVASQVVIREVPPGLIGEPHS